MRVKSIYLILRVDASINDDLVILKISEMKTLIFSVHFKPLIL